jgi:hypothetical protein
MGFGSKSSRHPGGKRKTSLNMFSGQAIGHFHEQRPLLPTANLLGRA